MRGLARLIFVLVFVAAAPASAQTIAEFQAIGQQAAAQYGVPWPVLQQLIQGESSWNANIGCNSSGACGIAQFIASTAATYGVDVNDPTSSLYGAAHYLSDLYAQDGSWVAALTAYSGGCSPSSPCNSAYAQAFADAQAADSGTTIAAGSGSGTSPTAPPSGGTSASALPFEWVYNQVIKGILGQINTSIQTVETITSKPATAVLALAIAIMGVMTLFGNMDMAVFLSFAIRAAIVMAFIQVGNTYYRDWIEAFVLGLPDYFAQAFSLTGSGGAPQQLFDGVLNGWTADALSVWHSSPWSFKAIFIGFCLAAATVLIVIPSLVAMFTVFLISSFLLMVMLAIGPLMILALLFRTTHRFLHGYVNVMVTGAIFALVVDIVLGIFSSTLTQVMANFKPSGSPDTDLPGIFGLAIVILVTGLSMGRLPRLVEAIGGGVAVSMDTAGRMMAGGFAKDIAEAGAAGVVARRIL